MGKVWFGDPAIQNRAQVLSREVRDGEVITTYRIGKLKVTGMHRAPSDQACAAFRESLDEMLARVVDRESAKPKKPGEVA